MNESLLRSSLEIAIEREGAITPRFYEILFARHPEARPMFSRNEPEKQQKMLQDALVAVLDHLDDAGWLDETLGGMGRIHVDYGVEPHMYEWVGEALIAALEEAVGDDWTPDHAAAWTAAYAAIRDRMLAGAGADARAH